MASPERLAIIGTGLIGASAGLAARRAGVAAVTGWDADPESLAVAAERGAAEATGSIAEAVVDADLVLVATPVGELASVVREALDRAPEGATVTDVGSTKRPVSAAAGGDRRFVGGHPICGAETRGPERASGRVDERANPPPHGGLSAQEGWQRPMAVGALSALPTGTGARHRGRNARRRRVRFDRGPSD